MKANGLYHKQFAMHADLLLGDDRGCFILVKRDLIISLVPVFTSPTLDSQHEHGECLDRKQLAPGIAAEKGRAMDSFAN